MPFRKSYHMPCRKRIRPFTLSLCETCGKNEEGVLPIDLAGPKYSSWPHWMKKRIYIKFAQRKYDANICFLQSKPLANMVKATFATIFTLIFTIFTLSWCANMVANVAFTMFATGLFWRKRVCIVFALCKFNVNLFFRAWCCSLHFIIAVTAIIDYKFKI